MRLACPRSVANVTDYYWQVRSMARSLHKGVRRCPAITTCALASIHPAHILRDTVHPNNTRANCKPSLGQS
jgi:hypothetical protein